MTMHHPAMEAGRQRRYVPNLWDAFAFGLLFGGLVLIVHGGHDALAPLATLEASPLSLDPALLPEYALRTTMRMLAAIVASLVFTFVYGALAAKCRRAEMVLIPLLDILQSVPVLGFLSFTVVGFMALFPGQRTLSSIGQRLSKTFSGGSIPVISARWPPAEIPVSTILVVSKLCCLALRSIHRNAQRQSSTAAGAREFRPRR